MTYYILRGVFIMMLTVNAQVEAQNLRTALSEEQKKGQLVIEIPTKVPSKVEFVRVLQKGKTWCQAWLVFGDMALHLFGYVGQKTNGEYFICLRKSKYNPVFKPSYPGKQVQLSNLKLEEYRKVEKVLDYTMKKLFPILFKDAELMAPTIGEDGETTRQVVVSPHMSTVRVGKQSCEDFAWSDWSKDQMTNGAVLRKYCSRCDKYESCSAALEIANNKKVVNIG